MISEAGGGEGADGTRVLREGQEEKVEGNEITEEKSLLTTAEFCPLLQSIWGISPQRLTIKTNSTSSAELH